MQKLIELNEQEICSVAGSHGWFKKIYMVYACKAACYALIKPELIAPCQEACEAFR